MLYTFIENIGNDNIEICMFLSIDILYFIFIIGKSKESGNLHSLCSDFKNCDIYIGKLFIL